MNEDAKAAKEITVLKLGAKADIGKGVSGIVTGIGIYHTGVRYRVAWCSNGSRYEQWVCTLEIGWHERKAVQQIGFASSVEVQQPSTDVSAPPTTETADGK